MMAIMVVAVVMVDVMVIRTCFLMDFVSVGIVMVCDFNVDRCLVFVMVVYDGFVVRLVQILIAVMVIIEVSRAVIGYLLLNEAS